MLYNVKVVYKREMEIEADSEGEAVAVFKGNIIEDIDENLWDIVSVDEIETENPYKKDYNWRDFINYLHIV